MGMILGGWARERDEERVTPFRSEPVCIRELRFKPELQDHYLALSGKYNGHFLAMCQEMNKAMGVATNGN